MSHEAVGNWIKNAKNGLSQAGMAPVADKAQKGLRIIVHVEPQNKGGMIMEVAEALRPWIAKLLSGVRDKDGMVVQPAHIRGIALNIAQDMVNEQQKLSA